jgi:acyl carrier protein phosphodiesterase
MNHLAHCLLADVAGRSIAGSMAGDFVRGRLPSAAASSPGNEFIEGIRFHRVVDSFTDDHPVVSRSKARLQPPYRRYAGILVDMHFDHCLARRWSEFSDATLEEFAARVARDIEAHRNEFPERARPFLEFFLRTNLLVTYREQGGIARALQGMSRRIRHPNPLASAMGELEAHTVSLEADFLEFFPEAMAMAKRIGGA